MIIAIDGPAGSGKSSVARAVAEKLNYRYIDTGAMYRAVGWRSGELGIDLSQEKRVADLARNMNIEFVPGKNGQEVWMDGNNVTALLKDEEIGRRASVVATQPGVREALVDKQREMGRAGDIVMDGRDIGTVVFPQADVKIFLDAAADERGKRRYLELQTHDQNIDMESTIRQIKKRDLEDRTRKVSPLRPAEDAVQIDTTHLNLNDVINQVLRLIRPPENR